MILRVERQRLRLPMLALIAPLLLCVIAIAPVGAVAQATPPTIGEIEVESYNCETGRMPIGVRVTDLPPSPAGASMADASFATSFTSTYESGSRYVDPSPSGVGSSPGDPPYTGHLYIFFNIPVTNPSGPTDDPLVSVEIFANVGFGGPGQGAIENPTDTTSLVYIVDCDGGLADELVAALKRILREVLDG